MVKLTKIYTKTGDDGTTGLADGTRVPKESLRVEAYGAVDEANAAIGLSIVECERAGGGSNAEIAPVLRSCQHDLFDVGADLATPRAADEKPGSRLRVLRSQTERLEPLIDRFNDSLSPLNSFVLPGGTGAAAALHLARTAVRRAERVAAALIRTEAATSNPETVRYLNRLSDLLFVLGRVANLGSAGDVLWKPGANR